MTQHISIYLDEFTANDLAALQAIFAAPGFFYSYSHQNTHGDVNLTDRAAQQFIRRAILTRNASLRTTWVAAIRQEYSRRLIGCVLLADVENGAGEIGYFVDQKFSGGHVAQQAAFSLLFWAKKHCGVETCWATVDPDTVASQRILAKLGLENEKYISQSRYCDSEGQVRPRWVMRASREKMTQALAEYADLATVPVLLALPPDGVPQTLFLHPVACAV
jgi:RimJ/RimL family protein N-acetyltransferase